MYVTSDIYDLKRIARFRNFEWRENLVGGVVVHGTHWPGYQAGARFLLEATQRCGIAIDSMGYASYSRPGEVRSHSIKAKSFEKLVRGELAGARNANGLLLRGARETIGTDTGTIWSGGEAYRQPASVGGMNGPVYIDSYPYPMFKAYFVFPLREPGLAKATELLRFAVEVLGAEYGYCFVRDEMCIPTIYPHGGQACLDHNIARPEVEEKHGWGDFAAEGCMWTQPWPIFRDLYQVNLVSKRHAQTPIEGLGYLFDWIGAQPDRGRLEDLDEGRWLWSLTDGEMVEVRPQLNAAGILYSCTERVYRDLPEGAAVAQRLFEDQRVDWAPWVSDAVRDYPGRFRG
jgi:hypothetical protein